jgi:hypothetical protein
MAIPFLFTLICMCILIMVNQIQNIVFLHSDIYVNILFFRVKQ